MMGVTTPTTENNRKLDDSPPSSNDAGGSVPSGFILKLFQMVNGAPDEVISWTPSGDAFVIGSDLNRLESETLPQYFRHNRFQSLVRQLNFYSFRKINRERNVWIYKHRLFHRDRPEELHLVRRRTCPGVDGRKQRFSRFSARKLSQFDTEESKQSQSEDDSSSIEDNSADDEVIVARSVMPPKQKRQYDSDEPEAPAKKAKRRWSNQNKPLDDKSIIIDTSIVSHVASPTSVSEPREGLIKLDSDDDASTDKKDDRLEMIEQSMVVSEVATKLEEYARKAMRGRGNSRTRRGGAGIVTPPWGTSQPIGAAKGLLTYDDEYEGGVFSTLSNIDRRVGQSTSAVVTDGDDSMTSEDVSFSGTTASKKQREKQLFVKAPVADSTIIKTISDRILSASTYNNHATLIASAAVATFCMSTPPHEDSALCTKIVELIDSCNVLATEFQQYRSALHPLACSGVSISFTLGLSSRKNARPRRKVWDGVANRSCAVRDFKTFAVNCIHKILGKNGGYGVRMPISKEDVAELQLTADIWLKSVGAIA